MRKKLFIVLLVYIQSCGYSQALMGLYQYGEQTLTFLRDSTVSFSIYGDGCFIWITKGKGKFVVKDNLLLISTKHNDAILHSDYKVLGNNPDSNISKISLIDSQGLPISFANVLVMDKNENGLKGSTTTSFEGKVILVTKPDYESVNFSFIGYGSLKIPFSKIRGKNVLITMQDWTVIENETLTFYIQFEDEKKLILVGPLNKKYVRLIQNKKLNRFNRKMKNDCFQPQTRTFSKSEL